MKQRRNRVFKIAAALLLAGSLSLQAQKVSFDNERLTLKQAFEKIEQVSKYKIAYNPSQLNVTRQVVLSQKNKTVPQVIEELLKGTDYTFEVKGEQIIIVPKKDAPAQKAKRKVTGRVTDPTGEAVIGASVIEKGTSNGVITDFDGNFSIDVSENATVVVSYVGSTSKEVALGSKTQLDITLEEDNNVLNEVVVVGYGTQKKGDITSSVGSVKSEDFTQGAVNDTGQLIQGKIAGLSVTNPSGDPTGKTEISLRGNTTILGASTNPLILIDGVPGDFNTVAPEDIESIDVLKDGSAAAIYGSRGTNGVVLITTKKAKGDNINHVEYSGYMSTSTIAKRLDFCTAADYRNQIASRLRDASWDKGGDTDWLDEITRTPFNHVHNLSFKGGTQKTNYVFNLNFSTLRDGRNKNQAAHPTDRMRRFSMR